jgi:hypothetical protein
MQKKKIDAFRKSRKSKQSSVYNGIERIFKEYKILRAAYHGGNFNGVNIITLMQKSQDIMDDFKNYMVEHKRGTAIVDEVRKLCVEVRKALVLLDDVFSKTNTKYESTNVDWVNKHCDETEKSVTLAMFQMRVMGFSITPKLHGLECHLVHQMRTVPGGIAMLIEHWVEQYHQRATEMERIWGGHSYDEQAEFRARREHMLSNTNTMVAEARIIESKRKVKRKRAETTVDEENRIKAGRLLIKQQVQDQMNSMMVDSEALEGDIDPDGNLGSL